MRHAILFSVLGASLIAIALSNGGAWYLLLWLAVNFWCIAVGYAGAGAGILGKGPAGRIAFWAKVVYLPYFLFSSCVWHLGRLLIRESAYNEIAPGLLLGRRLLTHEVPAGIANYVDLTAEFEDSVTIRKGRNYICLPVLDASVPVPDKLKTALSQAREGSTYVHCAQGHGRSALFALLLLADRGIVHSCEDGLALLQKARPGIRLNSAQRVFVERYMKQDPKGTVASPWRIPLFILSALFIVFIALPMGVKLLNMKSEYVTGGVIHNTLEYTRNTGGLWPRSWADLKSEFASAYTRMNFDIDPATATKQEIMSAIRPRSGMYLTYPGARRDLEQLWAELQRHRTDAPPQ